MRTASFNVKFPTWGWSIATTAAVLMILAPVAGVARPLPAAGAAAAEQERPEDFCERFLQTFASKDFETLRTFFAPGATVTGIWLAGQPIPETQPFGEWTKLVEEETAALEWLSFEVLETSVVHFARGTVASLRFHAKGRLGDTQTFSNDGIETYTLTVTDEAWKILHYSYVEMLEMDPPAAVAADE